jgi:outer membrane protein W
VKVYSTKFFVKFDYKNFFIDLSAMTNIISIDAKINTVHEGVKSVKKDIRYDVIMLGIGYKFAI